MSAATSDRLPVCLVLGGNGFVGSHIVDKLVARGDMRVKVLDRFTTNPQYGASKLIEEIVADAQSPATIGDHVAGADYVVQCLSATNPFTADINPFADIDNLRQSVGIFEQAAKSGVKKIIFISSGGAVYGKLTDKKVANENDIPMPVSPYGICKLATEHYLDYFKRKYGVDYVVYRLSNPYGPRQVFKEKQGVIPAFLSQIKEDREITIFGDGENSRDFIYVEDAAQMIADSFTVDNQHTIYNIGSGVQTSLKEIVAAIEEALRKEAKVIYKEAPKTAAAKTSISIQRFSEEFGLPAITPFRQGLLNSIEYMRESN